MKLKTEIGNVEKREIMQIGKEYASFFLKKRQNLRRDSGLGG